MSQTIEKHKALPEHARRRLLFYNDSEVDAAHVVNLLRGIGYTSITVVTDPRNLMSTLSSEGAYATLLLDLRMPNLDGLKAIYYVRKKFSAAELPILTISDADTPELCNAALLAGSNDHLFRPIDPVDVGLRIRNLLTIRSIYKSGQDAQTSLAREVAARTSKLNMLIQNGILMSKMTDPDTLIRHTLFEGRRILHCDAATMYRLTPQRSLRFCMRTRSDGLPDSEIPLYDSATGLPNDHYASTWAALNQRPVRIDDVYSETRFDLSGTRSFDAHTGYRTVSMLTVPLMPREGYVLGVLQFINKLDDDTDAVIPFSDEMVTWVEALASQAAVALDWIVPGPPGEDAPLSAAATRDAAVRLQALGLPQTQSTSTRITRTTRAGPVGTLRLRVAQGPALNGYLGVSIALRPASRLKKPVIAWLALVETIPAGVEGSPVERNLVRNVLSPAWSGPEALSKSHGMRRVETRVMGIPAGANPQRLRVVGWVEDMQGRIRVIAQSHCAPSP